MAATRRTSVEALIEASNKRTLRTADADVLRDVDRLLDARVPKQKIVDWLREDPAYRWVEFKHVDSYYDFRRRKSGE